MRVDWAAIDRSVFREVGLTPAEMDQMTLAEIAVVTEREPEAGEEVAADADIAAHLGRLATMTAEERLWAEVQS